MFNKKAKESQQEIDRLRQRIGYLEEDILSLQKDDYKIGVRIERLLNYLELDEVSNSEVVIVKREPL